jgi:hypothetical protein
LIYASDKAYSVRSLYRTSAPIQHAGGELKAITPKFIPAGIITTSSEWGSLFNSPLTSYLQDFSGDRRINFGCVLDEGSFEMDFVNLSLIKSERSNSLIFFF